MNSSTLSAFTRPGSYWQASRAPRYSLLFALPLLVFYEVLAALQSQGGGGGPEAGLRNGADVILQSLFIAVAGAWGPVLFMACLIAAGLWLVVRDLQRHPGALRPSVFLRRLGASTVLSLGAGLYEELLFRVVLVTLLATLAQQLFGWRPWHAGAFATVLGAAIFSAFHYIGPYGDRLMLYSFTFRMIAGIFFSALYLLRGFGITAWTHALYDLFLLAT